MDEHIARKIAVDEDDFKGANDTNHQAEEGILMIAHHLSLLGLDLHTAFADLLYDYTLDSKEFELLSIRDFSAVVKSDVFGLQE